jgi:transcriptional regulator of arginine metabolism
VPEKRRRQRAILRIVRGHAVSNQEELVALLEKHAGISATQASVSRDVRELGLVKVDGRYVQAQRLASASADGEPNPIHELITGSEPIGANLVIVHTRVGAASAVAAELDARLGEDAAGTIAGDDTIFIAVRSRAVQGRVVASLRALTPELLPH